MQLQSAVAQYITVTASYWAFTLTDGALRMLVLLFFHDLGYSPIELASLFLLYEFFGIVTNLYGGWLASRIGTTLCMQIGLSLQNRGANHAAGRAKPTDDSLCDGGAGAFGRG